MGIGVLMTEGGACQGVSGQVSTYRSTIKGLKAIETGTGPDGHSPLIINAHVIIVTLRSLWP
jgi:hypothetical protein